MRESSSGGLGNTYEGCVGPPPLKWRPGFPDDPGILELSPDAERDFAAAELEDEIRQGREKRIRDRYSLQAEAARLLVAGRHPSGHRIASCGKRRIRKSGDVEVWRSPDGGAFFGNVQVCSLLWLCPVCAAKISERRRLELREAIAAARERGLRVFMLTFTIPHHCRDQAKDLCDRLLHARKLLQNRAWRRWSKRIGLRGMIRALEVTYSRNGAHVHIHALLFCENGGASPSAAELLPHWKRACLSAGLPEPNEHGVDIQNADHAADYVGKWGLDSELTKSHIKRGRSGSLTAFDLLRVSAGLLESEWMDRETAGRKFLEHATAFTGRHQLVWTNGLRAELGLVEQERTDQELAEEKTEDGEFVAAIPHLDWRRVVRSQARAELLIVARKHGAPGVRAFLERLAETDRKTPQHVWRN
jgi:hypothetical protein